MVIIVFALLLFGSVRYHLKCRQTDRRWFIAIEDIELDDLKGRNKHLSSSQRTIGVAEPVFDTVKHVTTRIAMQNNVTC